MKQLDEIVTEILAKQEDKLMQVYENRFSVFESNVKAMLKEGKMCKYLEERVSTEKVILMFSSWV